MRGTVVVIVITRSSNNAQSEGKNGHTKEIFFPEIFGCGASFAGCVDSLTLNQYPCLCPAFIPQPTGRNRQDQPQKDQMPATPKSVTELLLDWRNGDEGALDQLMPLVYDELRRIARRYLRREDSDHTLQTAALVNEAYLRLVDQRQVEWQNRAHFFAVAARLMRRVLLDYARKKQSDKRGGKILLLQLEAIPDLPDDKAVEVMALDDALRSLEKVDPEKCRIVEMRYFGGLTIAEAADVLSLSESTVVRQWRSARAFLKRQLIRGAVHNASDSLRQ
jgi:RNA polymerase sigma factor (TIGR02999 family)